MPIVVPSTNCLFSIQIDQPFPNATFSFFSNGGKTAVNSEELEQSLKAEFENYLNGLLAEMRGDVAELQAKIEAEMEKHRTQLDAAFQGFSTRFEKPPGFDGGFTESVIEHLRLARDEGATVSATAFAEAAELDKAAVPDRSLGDIKAAIDDISSKDSQSAILKALIQHAAAFTPRGAFFIVKNSQFVGWKVFGRESGESEAAVRDIHFPVTDDSILGKAVEGRSTVEGSFGAYADDHLFLDPLHFGRPDRTYAIPLVARGRGVAVLYADYGREGVDVNTDALEMLVKVAGLTVEVLAAARTDHSGEHEPYSAELSEQTVEHVEEPQTFQASPFQQAPQQESPIPQTFSTPFTVPAPEPVTPEPVEATRDFGHAIADSPANEFDHVSNVDTPPVHTFEEPAVPAWPPQFSNEAAFEPPPPAVEAGAFPTTADFEMTPAVVDHVAETAPPIDDSKLTEELKAFDASAIPELPVEPVPITESAIVFEPPQPPIDPIRSEQSPFGHVAEQIQTTTFPTAIPATPVVEAVAARPSGSRLSDRQVDLPIEVAEDERRLHNDARRFARLLVSEIKLYNEKKVQEGRENNDLYERLREAIDRSREMYDKRVQTPVSSKFDYFHYELVNALAEGDVSRLGPRYPGATV